MKEKNNEHPKDCVCAFCIRTGKAGPYPYLRRFFPELWKFSKDKFKEDKRV